MCRTVEGWARRVERSAVVARINSIVTLNIPTFRFFALLFFAGAALSFGQATPTPKPSVVYSIKENAAISQYHTNPEVVRKMVDRLVIALTAQTDVAKAWASLVAPNERVGIKISAAGGELFATHRDVVDAIVNGLVAAGHSRKDIIVWDRQLEGIKKAGYQPGAEGYQLLSIPPRDGYDPKAVFTAPAMGKLIWGDLDYIPQRGENPMRSETANTSNVSHFAKIVTSQVDKIINVPVLSDSFATGLAGCLYNVTLPNIDNWRRFAQYGRFGAAGVAQVYADPNIGPKVVVNIMDGLIAAYAGGPESHPNYAVHYGTIFASKDPVAIDALALRRLEQMRADAKMPPIGELASHVPLAGEMGLGNADPAHI
ncbi:MAG: DUF362 domain-containing protein, partial [Chthoniobacterales bacterium]